MQTALQRTFSEAILTQLHPRSEILITLHILSQDGSVLATCINACTLALIDAGIPMTDYVVACTAGSYLARSKNSEDEDEDPLLDTNNLEESDLPSITVGTSGGVEKITLLQLETKVRLERLEGMLAVALDGCGKLRELMDEIVRVHGNKMVINI
jgi:exosome complex component RRP41